MDLQLHITSADLIALAAPAIPIYIVLRLRSRRRHGDDPNALPPPDARPLIRDRRQGDP